MVCPRVREARGFTVLWRRGGCPARSFPIAALKPLFGSQFKVGDGEGQRQVCPSGRQAGGGGGSVRMEAQL